MLKQNNVAFSSFDLTDNRKMALWVKHYSGSHNFPQLFAQGKCVGDEGNKMGAFIASLAKKTE
jgi:glutaredoxin